jgi:hypothetical protein
MCRSHQDPGASRRAPDLDVSLVGPIHCGALFAAIAALGLYQALTLAVNCDVVVLLHEAGRLLDGARLYVDIMEINPPLIIYLNLPVVVTSRVLGVSPQILLPIFVFALTLCSLGLCHRLRSCLPAGLGQAALLLVAFVLLVLVGGMFGQREHLLLILILPYAFAAAILSDGGKVPRALACGTGVMAGIGFALKPHFLPAFLAVELYLAARRGPRILCRAQALAAWAFFSAYAAALLVLTPEYLPFAWSIRDVYASYHPYGGQLFGQFTWITEVITLSVVLAIGLVRRRAKGWSDVLCLLGLLLTAGVYVQAKGFLYHWYPVLAVALVLMGVAALALGLSRPSWWTNPGATLTLLVLASCTLAGLFWSDAGDSTGDPELERAVRDRGGPIYGLSCTTDPLSIAEKIGVGWATDNHSLLPIQAYYRSSNWRPGGYHAWDRMPEAERQFLSRIVADLERARPALLLVDKLPPSPEMAGFDYLEYLRREPRFPRVMARYRYVRRFLRFRVYELDSTHGVARPEVARGHSRVDSAPLVPSRRPSPARGEGAI